MPKRKLKPGESYKTDETDWRHQPRKRQTTAATDKFRNDLIKKATSPTIRKQLADVLVGEALKGERWAILELNDRLLGKASQGVDVTSKGGKVNGIVILPPLINNNDKHQALP